MMNNEQKGKKVLLLLSLFILLGPLFSTVFTLIGIDNSQLIIIDWLFHESVER